MAVEPPREKPRTAIRSASITLFHSPVPVSLSMTVESSAVRSQSFGVLTGVESPLVVPGWLGPATMKPASASAVASQLIA
ncbi:hypothetical protein D9M70_649940 [compost metagenome]